MCLICNQDKPSTTRQSWSGRQRLSILYIYVTGPFLTDILDLPVLILCQVITMLPVYTHSPGRSSVDVLVRWEHPLSDAGSSTLHTLPHLPDDVWLSRARSETLILKMLWVILCLFYLQCVYVCIKVVSLLTMCSKIVSSVYVCSKVVAIDLTPSTLNSCSHRIQKTIIV